MQTEELQALNVSLHRMLRSWRLRNLLKENRPLSSQGRRFIRDILAGVVDEEEEALEASLGVSLTDALEIDGAFRRLEQLLGPQAFVVCTLHHLDRVVRRDAFKLTARDLFTDEARAALRASQ